MHASGPFTHLPLPNRIAILASYPSGNSMIVEARDNLTELMLGQKLMNSSYTTPFVSHGPMPALERTPQYIFVGALCEAGTYSPYLCPSDYGHYHFPAVRDFLHRRADLRDFLGRLGGQILVCDCNFSAGECWAHLLQCAFCETFDTTLGTDIINDYIDNANTEMNSHNFDLLAGGLQPTRRRPSQLIGNGLLPHEHLQQALALEHPFISSSSSTSSILRGLAWSLDDPHELIRRRDAITVLVMELSQLTRKENDSFVKILDKSVLKVLRAYGNKDIVLMRELSFVCHSSDGETAMWMALGLPMHGWAPSALGLMTRVKQPAEAYCDWSFKRLERNDKVLLSVKSSGDRKLDVAAFQKTMDEKCAGVIDGPVYNLKSLSLVSPCLAPGVGIWEEHGDATCASVRNIDDLLFGGQNDVTGTMNSHRPTDVDGLVAQVRATTVRFGLELLIGWKSDYSKAFKQVPSSPLQIEDFVVCQFDPHMERPAFFMTYSQLFGGKSAPLNFSRYPEWTTEILAILWAVPASSCVDDVICVERASTAESGRNAWMCLTSCTGWLISMEKSPPPSKQFVVIGVSLDLRPWPISDPLVSVTMKRLQALDTTVRKILASKLFGSGQASSLVGKLGFTVTAAFGRIGRAKLRPIINRAYSRSKIMDMKLYTCLLWWLRFFYVYRPRPIPSSLECLPTIMS